MKNPPKYQLKNYPDTAMTDKTFTQLSYNPQLEQEHRFKEHVGDFNSDPEDQSFKEIDENRGLEKLLKNLVN
jgi:hypothetical protein